MHRKPPSKLCGPRGLRSTTLAAAQSFERTRSLAALQLPWTLTKRGHLRQVGNPRVRKWLQGPADAEWMRPRETRLLSSGWRRRSDESKCSASCMSIVLFTCEHHPIVISQRVLFFRDQRLDLVRDQVNSLSLSLPVRQPRTRRHVPALELGHLKARLKP